jgi:hypothetical protein
MRWSAGLRAFGIDFEVEARGLPAAFVPDILAAFGPARGTPVLRYRVDGHPDPAMLGWAPVLPALFRDGAPIYWSDYLPDLGRAFELDLYRQLVARAEGLFILHAAAVEIDGRAVVLAGDSGAGKSTMAQALIERGAGYISDEYVGLDVRGQVQGVPRPLTPTDGVLPAVIPAGFRAGGYPLRLASTGEIIDYGFLQPPRMVHEPVPLAALVLLRYSPGEEPGVRLVPGGEALMRLWHCTYRTGAEAMAIAEHLLASNPAHELVTRSIEGACADLQRLL